MRAHTLGCRKALLAAIAVSLFATAMIAAPAAHPASGGSGLPLPPPTGSGGVAGGVLPPAPVPGPAARLAADGRTAIPPAAAPEAVKRAIYAANQITRKPYRYGGGHRRFKDSGYDCSGSVSYALHGGGLLASPLHSRAFMSWADPGEGQWITVYTNPGHAYVVIAGLRFDTSGEGGRGPRWRTEPRSPKGFRARHFPGL